MSLEEKAAQLQSAAPSLPVLGIPAYDWWSEGLHGIARNGYATVFPQAIGLAASWNTDLLRQVGEAVSDEARAKYREAGLASDHGRYQGLTIWSPNINIFRDPRWGRGQETYGEDPTLTGRLAVAFIGGLQGDDPGHPKVIATPKHFAVHSGPEAGRHAFDVDVSPHDLEATYLPAFRAAVTEGHAASVMCAYNALHGTPVCADTALLNDRLRGQWGFTGFVVSDCDAIEDMVRFHNANPDFPTAAAAALNAGTDLNCGTVYAALPEAVRRGLVSEQTLDRALGRLFHAREALGMAGFSDRAPAEGPSEHAELALEAARQSIVLLQNRGRLPLKRGSRIAVVGPNADALGVLEANYHGTAEAPLTPLQALRQAGPVLYAQGASIAEGVPVPIPETALRSGRQTGLAGAYYDGLDFSGAPRVKRLDRTIDFDWDHVPPAPGLESRHYAVRWSGTLSPPGPGDYTLAARIDRCFDCRGHDPVRLTIDGKTVIEDGGDGRNIEAVVHFADTRPKRLSLEMIHSGEDQGIHLEWVAPAEAQLAEAAAAAKAADVTVAFVGLSPDVEGEELKIAVPGFEGGDRTDIALPLAQRRLLERVAATGTPLVVVLMSGSAVASPSMTEKADALLAAWYPGQAGGRAIAETLFGVNNPAGRLPVTFYRSTRDLPPFVDYAMTGRTYRYFKGDPLFPFGHGLSYTSFTYGGATVSADEIAAGGTVEIGADIRNSGFRDGDEVVQLYLTPPAGALAPIRSLIGFQRVRLAAGESRHVTFTVAPRALSSVDASGTRRVEPGRYGLYIGGGQPGDGAGTALDLTIRGQEVLPP